MCGCIECSSDPLIGIVFRYRDVTNGIRAEALTLGPIWAKHELRKHEDVKTNQ